MACFRVYFDDSAPKDESVLCIAGYVASMDFWDEVFLPKWRELLANAPHRAAIDARLAAKARDKGKGKPQVFEFKAADCRSYRDLFQDYEKADTTALFTAAVDLITKESDPLHFAGIGVAVRLPPVERLERFRKLTPSEREEANRLRKNDIFKFCVTLILTDTLVIASRLFDEGSDSLEIIFDDQPGQIGKTWGFFDEVKAGIEAELRCKVPTPVFRDSCEVLPLQAADLLAHETMKEVVNRAQEPRMYPTSIALGRLVEARLHSAYYVDWNEWPEEEPVKHILYRSPNWPVAGE